MTQTTNTLPTGLTRFAWGKPEQSIYIHNECQANVTLWPAMLDSSAKPFTKIARCDKCNKPVNPGDLT